MELGRRKKLNEIPQVGTFEEKGPADH